MYVPEPNQQPTPLKERLRYFMLVMLILPPAATFVVLVLGAFIIIFSDKDFPPSRYGSDPVYRIDYEFCLEIRPKEELEDCLRGYGWFDPPVKQEDGW
jgi:hypothetical protein